ncbi:MAG: DEAD/DEAH box helicase [Acidobacteria bacterium]|nr:DEAD/DEAH box helicase [Acidobacteriota bacterium]
MSLRPHLGKYFSSGIQSRGARLWAMGRVKLLSGNQWEVSASVRGTYLYSVKLSRQQDTIRCSCECPYFDSEGACKHIWAAILEAEEKNYLLGNGGGRPPELVEDWDNGRTPAPPKPAPPPQWRTVLDRLAAEAGRRRSSEVWRDGREIYYIIDAAATSAYQSLYLEIALRERKQNGEWGKLKAYRIPRENVRKLPDEGDRDILTLLGGVGELYSFEDASMPSAFRLRTGLPAALLPKLCATGRCRLRAGGLASMEEPAALDWDDGPPWQLRLVVERSQDHWVLQGRLERDAERMGLEEPALLIEDGLVFAHGRAARLDHGGAFEWISLLRKERRIEVSEAQGPEFVAELLNGRRLPPVDWPEDLRVEHVKATPKPHLTLEEPHFYAGRKGRLRGQVSFDYDGRMIPHDRYTRGLYDPSRRRYLERDHAAESAMLGRLVDLGLKWTPPTYGESGPRWELSAKRLPSVVRDLMREGWQVEAEGKIFRHASGFHAELTSGIDWFDLDCAVDYGPGQVKMPELLRAIEKGENLIRLSDGSYGLLPEEWLAKYGLLARMGKLEEDRVRFSRTQTGLLDVFLSQLPEIQPDEVFAKAREELRRFDGIQPAAQPEGFVGELRGYQREGLAWMYFLERLAWGGCLADDMGVGKTPQVLALLETRRELRAAAPPNQARRIGPSLVVVPRSLAYNWKQEAARFTPRLRILDHSGPGRDKTPEKLQDYDVVLTTYGTLRRDVIELRDVEFDYIVLDEAQAIKNASSESAKAARLLRGNQRLAMSGTPVENHLGELWSLFEFLNPGMLGASSALQGSRSALRNPDEATRQMLSKALRPFILRRTKAQVAPELPPKVEQTLYCELEAQQRTLYNELRDHYRDTLLRRVEDDGINKSRMHILEALLRLRQAACHPGLIDKKRTADPSAKLDMLLPQLAEVIDEGHKVLVFSQFTSLLAIVRQHLDRDGIVYAYLDGQTRDRQACVERFQSDPDCRLFLVSLKAGGLGLNLTAAEYVFLLDPWWNPAVEAQAIDRTHRIGQSRNVFAYRLIARETVEEKVLELQNSKRDLADAIINADNRLVSNLKREDLELLLS